MKDINEKNDLDYINEVSPEELKGLFFMDYQDTNDVRWVRNPWMDCRDLAICTATMDWSNVENFRVQSYEDLVQPVNEDGFTKYQCESRNIDFVPECQKIEYLFGSRYTIDRDSFELFADFGSRGRLNKGLYFGSETGLIVTDAEKTITSSVGNEDAFNDPENSTVLLDMSLHKNELSSARQILENNGLDNTWGAILLQKLLEDALKDLKFDPEPESHSVISYIKELDEMDIETAA
jgi:hypothetical protein